MNNKKANKQSIEKQLNVRKGASSPVKMTIVYVARQWKLEKI